MNISEITNLIKIKEYLSNAINNFSIDKSTVTELSKLIPVIDNKIISLLRSDEFKSSLKIKWKYL